jgi:hypothetical protein
MLKPSSVSDQRRRAPNTTPSTTQLVAQTISNTNTGNGETWPELMIKAGWTVVTVDLSTAARTGDYPAQ